MSKIPESVVAAVVTEASTRMKEATYAQVAVGTWVREQPAATHYMTAHARELGGAEAVVSAVFHASLLAACVRRHVGRSVRSMSFADLDAVSEGDREARLRRVQPALADYLVANVEDAEMQKVLTLIALALDHVS